MASLQELLGTEPKRAEVVADALVVLDAEVGDKRGLGGIAVKGAYKIVKGVRPGFTKAAVDRLLDGFLEALDPFYQGALSEGVAPSAYVAKRDGEVAEALLAVTDDHARNAQNRVVKKTYEKLRGAALTHVRAATPRLAEMIARHADTA
jgi:hypothetical protein